MMRKLRKTEKALLFTTVLLLSGIYVFHNTSFTKEGFIRSFSRSYDQYIQTNTSTDSFYKALALAAEKRTSLKIIYDGSYQEIPYPNGDVDEGIGVCTDVVIRSYRSHNIDLQELVHIDMSEGFTRYPKIWRKLKPDTNIDHRRVPNLMTFFKRKGTVLPITMNPLDYEAGDIVAWNFGNGLMHIGIVSTKTSSNRNIPLIVHNIGRGPEISDLLFNYPIIGHFRYKPSNQGMDPTESGD